MDTNLFPVLLVLSTLITGVIWLIDSLFFRSKRVSIAKENAESEDGAAEDPVLVEYAKSFFPVLAIVLVLRSFVVEPFQIPSASMEPTLIEGDFILVNKFHYGLRLPITGTKVLPLSSPKRGDVMVFIPPHDTRYFIKRVVGLPGDVIHYEGKQLYINGKPAPLEFQEALPASAPYKEVYEESLDGHLHLTQKMLGGQGRKLEGKFTVPQGHYFMMGDNRDNSADSRAWGSVPDSHIVGKAFATWMHWRSVTSLPSFSRNGFIQ